MISNIPYKFRMLGYRRLGSGRYPKLGLLDEPVLGGRGGKRSIYYGIEPDAANFLQAASITYAYQIRALDWLVRQLKAQGLWSSLKTAYPFVGGNATAHAFNLVNVGTASVANNYLTFNGTFTHNDFGSTGSGSSGSSANPQITPSTFFTNNFLHLSFYCQTKGGAADSMIEIGSNGGARFNDLFANFSGSSFFDANDTGNGRTSFSDTDARGMLLGTRTASNSAKMFKNRSLAATNSLTQTSTLSTAGMVFWGFTNTSNNSNRTLSWISTGDGLTDNQAQVLSDLVEIFQQKMRRSII